MKILVDSKYFQRGILLAILVNTLSMGIEYHNQVRQLLLSYFSLDLLHFPHSVHARFHGHFLQHTEHRFSLFNIIGKFILYSFILCFVLSLSLSLSFSLSLSLSLSFSLSLSSFACWVCGECLQNRPYCNVNRLQFSLKCYTRYAIIDTQVLMWYIVNDTTLTCNCYK